MPSRDDQHVYRRLRVDVLEGDQPVVLVDDGRRNLAVDDLAEEAVGHVFQLPGFSSQLSAKISAESGQLIADS